MNIAFQTWQQSKRLMMLSNMRKFSQNSESTFLMLLFLLASDAFRTETKPKKEEAGGEKNEQKKKKNPTEKRS